MTKNHKENEIKNIQQPTNVSKIMLFVTMAMPIITLIGIGITWYVSYHALLLNTRAIETAYRPYVGVSKIEVLFIKSKMRIRIEYKNFGNVPANTVQVTSDLSSLSVVPEKRGDLIPKHAPWLLFPNIPNDTTFVILDEKVSERIAKGEETLTASIYITYKGIDGVYHYTKENYQYNPFLKCFYSISGDAN
jgi:hypothetical protein